MHKKTTRRDRTSTQPSGFQLIKTLGAAGTWIARIEFSPDGSQLSIAAQFGQVQLWDVSTGKVRRKFLLPSYHAYSAAWSPDGETIATSSDDRLIGLWSTSTGNRVGELEVYTESEAEIRRAAWEKKYPDRTFSSTNDPLIVKQWLSSRSAAWSPTGKMIAS